MKEYPLIIGHLYNYHGSEMQKSVDDFHCLTVKILFRNGTNAFIVLVKFFKEEFSTMVFCYQNCSDLL